jgi:hypothetical protein
VTKAKHWWSKREEVDAETYYFSKMQELTELLEVEERKAMMRNSGFAFITFRSKQISMRFQIDKYYKEKLKRTSIQYESQMRRGVNLRLCSSQLAYLESDLKWENIGKDSFLAQLKRVAMFLLLMIVSIIIITPAFLVEMLGPLE